MSTDPDFNLSTYYYPINNNNNNNNDININYNNYTLLISIPSISNISCYSIDAILLNDTTFIKLGYINDQNIIIASGNTNNKIVLPIELYISYKYNIILLQNRCPIRKVYIFIF